MELSIWPYGDDFKTLILRVTSRLPLRKPSLLEEPLVARLIHQRTTGLLGELVTLLKSAARYAITSGSESITTVELNACGYLGPEQRTESFPGEMMRQDFLHTPLNETIRREYLPEVPLPQAGEMLAAYIVRLAVANGLEPIALSRWISNETHSGRWILYPSHPMRTSLASLTNLDLTSINEMGFDQELEHLPYPFAHAKDAGNWLIPVPDALSQRPSLAQICPECLLEDRTPYLRKIWRFAFLTHCPRHRIPLIERCPDCQAPMDPFGEVRKDILTLRGGLFLRCLTCGFHLHSLPSNPDRTESPSTIGSIHLSIKILRALKENWTEVEGCGSVATPPFISGLRIILRLLGTRFGLELLMWSEDAAHLEPSSNTQADYHPYMRFEDLPISRRARLLAVVDWYLEDWPNRFVEGCRVSGLYGSFVLEQKRRELPFWIASAVSDPLARLSHPNLPLDATPRAFGSRRSEKSSVGLRPNSFDRLDFVQEHPEWWGDLTQMARGMRDMGLYGKNHPLNSIERTCRHYLDIVIEHQTRPNLRRRRLSISGYFNRRSLQRKFLNAFKRAIATRIGLD